MKFSKRKKMKIRKKKEKKIKRFFNSLYRYQTLDIFVKFSEREDERLLELISKKEVNNKYYLLCTNHILHKSNIYEICFDNSIFIRKLTNKQICSKLNVFKEWFKEVNHLSRKRCLKYKLRNNGNIKTVSTIPPSYI